MLIRCSLVKDVGVFDVKLVRCNPKNNKTIKCNVLPVRFVVFACEMTFDLCQGGYACVCLSVSGMTELIVTKSDSFIFVF